MHSKNIAIIGGGVAGLTAGYLLHDNHRVTLFEKTHRIGGNAYTYTTADGQDLDIAVAAFGMAGTTTSTASWTSWAWRRISARSLT